MRIALDAMGSDKAPKPEIKGMQEALHEFSDLGISLIGKIDLLNNANSLTESSRLEIIDTNEVIGMHEAPSEALRLKRNSSIALAINLLKEKRADAMVSAGNTGAIMAFAMSYLGTVAGIDRPALAAIFPNLKGSTFVIDIGANVNVKPINLYQFAVMGSITASFMFKKANPTVGLLNIGQEEKKGTEITQSAYKLLQQSDLNFVGNVEGYDVLRGSCDVIVCDGFVGNVVLKFGEGMAEIVSEMLEEYLASASKYRVRRWLSKPVLSEFISRMSYEEYGGALLLGVNGTVVIGHGRSSSKALKNAIKTAICAVQGKTLEHIAEKFQVK
ncbi:MAG: phosphate acyltransferase PlsX [Candidatus Latescibacteria bacterium]|nr:phosphate acyltransferase PlsX [Candidatus Latescibacterota bacterium]